MDTNLAGSQETKQPPRLARLPSEVLFEDCLSAPVKITLQQLAALAEDAPHHAIPPITLPHLAGLTSLSPPTLRVHLAILQAYRSAVRLQRAGRGCFSLVLADWLFLPLSGCPEPGTSCPVQETISLPHTGQAVHPPLAPAGSLAASHSPLLPFTAPHANRINILINPINQEEEGDPVLKTTEGLPPPPDINNTPGSGVELSGKLPPMATPGLAGTTARTGMSTPMETTASASVALPGRTTSSVGATPAPLETTIPPGVQLQSGSDPPLPKARSKAHRTRSPKAADPASGGSPSENRRPPLKTTGGKNPAASPPGELSPAVRQALADSGVFKSLFPEVSRAGWSDEELLALLAWSRADNPKRPGGLFMVRLRSGLTPPEAYYAPPCPTCGKLGGEHASDCSQRYISGPYASFVKH